MSNPSIPQGVVVQSFSDVERAATPVRAMHTFKVPEKISKATGVKTIGVVELTGYEELVATKRANGEAMRVASELAKEALKQIDGKPLSDAEMETFWALPKFAKLRTLVLTAFNDVNQPSQNDAASFLATHEIEV